MQQTSFPVEYDFKRAILDLVDKSTGTIKNKYKCLPLMITLPLSRPLDPLPPPNQPDPSYKQTILKSTSNTDGWLNFIPIENLQPNIITIDDNILRITKFSYNYDITVDIINKGINDVVLRFMAQNPFSLLAANMNDIYLNETSFTNIKNGKQIKFTITGEYQFFYVNYPTENFDINITINISNIEAPILICDNKCKNCTCYDIDGNGYIKLKKKSKSIYVPVYTTRIIGNTITKYLYPEFSYLRDLFYDITLLNSLTPPLLNSLTQQTGTSESKSIIKLLPDTTVINCGISNGTIFCPTRLWGFYDKISGDLVRLTTSLLGCPLDTIVQTSSIYRYSWNDTPSLAHSNIKLTVSFGVYFRQVGSWYEQKSYLLNSKFNEQNIRYEYSLPGGFYENLSSYQWIAFGLISNNLDTLSLTPNPDSRFNITIDQII
jgi:hypothetical protein